MSTELNINNKLEDINSFSGKWYVVNCYSGQEDRVKEDLSNRIKSLNKSNIIFDIRVIKEKVSSKKHKKVIEKNLYPGYIFINMVMDDEAWYIVRNTTGVTGFIGSSGKGTKPFPLTEKEAKTMLQKDYTSKSSGDKPKKVFIKAEFNKGDYVVITEGAFEGKEGQVIELDDSKGVATINLDFFGRFTPTEIDYKNCKKGN